MFLPPNKTLLHKYYRASYILTGFLLLIPILVLIGWNWDLHALRKMGSSSIGMNPLTAILFILSACSLWFLRRKTNLTGDKRIGHGIAWAILILAVNRLMSSWGLFDIPVDKLLYPEKLNAFATLGRSGRLSTNNAVCFIIISGALLLSQKTTRSGHRPAQFLVVLIGLIGILSLLSYLYQTGNFLGFISEIPIALSTSVCYLLFTFAFLYAWPDKGLMRHITTQLSGSLTARVLLPTAILLPTLFGLLRLWGYWRGFYDTEFGVALFSLMTIISLLAVAWYSAVSLNKRELLQLRTRRRLEESESEIKAIFQSAPDAVVVLDQQGNIVKWNPEAYKMFGWKEEEVIRKDVFTVIMPEELRQQQRDVLKKFDEESKRNEWLNKSIELWALHKDGSSFDIEIRLSPFARDNRNYFVLFIRDITEKTKLEQKLQQFNKELSQQVDEKVSEITDILNRITEGFIALDRNFVYTYANKKIGEITGMDPKDMIGKNVWELFPDAIHSSTYEAFHRALETQQFVKCNDYFEPLNLWQENHIYPSKDGLTIFVRDISDKKRAEKEINKALSMADTLIDSLPGVFYFYDEFGKFIRWNDQFEKATGYSTEEIAQMHPSQFFPPDQQEYIAERIKGVFEMGQNDAEADLLHKNGTRQRHYFKARLIDYDGKRCLLGTGIDMTEKLRAEEELKLSEQKYRLLFFRNPLSMWMQSLPDYRIIEANESALNQYGYSREEFIGMDVIKLRPKEDEALFIQKTNKLFRGIFYAGIWRHLKKDGTIIYVNIITHDTWYEGQPVRLVLANEVTEQYLSEEKLKESYSNIKRLTEHLNAVREQERLHIAREIHDELGQLLTVMKMDVSWLNKKLQPEEGPIKDKMDDLFSVLDTTVKTVRRISSELRPSLIDDLGLVAAMEWHLEEFKKRSGLQVEAQFTHDELELQDNIKIGLYRILQESLTNVARHSQAKSVKVFLQKTENQLILSVEDNGIGFDPEKKTKKTLGLVGAKERAEGMGGTYQIISELNKGTKIVVSIPFN